MASGGQYAVDAWQYAVEHPEGPDLLARPPGSLPPPLRGAPGEASAPRAPGWQVEPYWHASICKKAAHVFGTEVFGSAERPVWTLVSLDCHNMMSPTFLPHCDELHARCNPQVLATAAHPLLTVHGVRYGPGTSGRIGMSATWFFEVGGYDQDAYGTGYKDIDLNRHLEKTAQQWLPKRQWLRYLQNREDVGVAVPNDGSNWKRDRGAAKTANLNPNVSGTSWGNINAWKHQVMAARLQAGQVLRNAAVVRATDNSRLGCWWCQVAPGPTCAVLPGPSHAAASVAAPSLASQPSGLERPQPPPAPPPRATPATLPTGMQQPGGRLPVRVVIRAAGVRFMPQYGASPARPPP